MTRRAAAVAALALVAGTRLIALPEPIGIDQGIFATAGWGLTRGLMLYRDVWDQKPPGIHLLYAFAFAIVGARPAAILILDTIAWTAVVMVACAIAGRLSSERAAIATGLVLAVTTFPPFYHPYGGFLERAVPETFIAALAAAAVWAAITGRFAWSGLAIGAAAVFKPTALIYWPCCVLITAATRGQARRALVRSALTVMLPWIAVAVWLLAAGAAGDARVAIIDYNRGYVAVGSGLLLLPLRMAHEVWRLVKSDPAWLLAAAGGIAAVLAAWQARSWRGIAPAPLTAALWLGAVIIAIAANGVRMYANYFLPAAAPVAILGGWFLAEHLRGRRAIAGVLVLLLSLLVTWRSNAVPRSARFVAADMARLRGTMAREPYLDLFGRESDGRRYSARANAELADYLGAHTAPGDRIYLFGMAPSVYFMARRLPANRFVWTYPAVAPFVHAPGFGADSLADDLGRQAPARLVLEANNRDSASGWRIEDVYAAPAVRALLGRYRAEIVIQDFTVLQRVVK